MPAPKKLTDVERESIRRLWRERPTLKRLAHLYGVHKTTISRLIHEDDETPQALNNLPFHVEQSR